MLRLATVKFDTFLKNRICLFLSTASPSPNDDHSYRNPERFAQPSSFLDDSAFNIVPYFDFPGVIIVSVCDSDHDSRISAFRKDKRDPLFLDNKRTPLSVQHSFEATLDPSPGYSLFILCFFSSFFFSSLSLSFSICRSSNFRSFELMNNPISDFLKMWSLSV